MRIKGDGTIEGLAVGGLPNASVTPDDLTQKMTLLGVQNATGTIVTFTGIPSWAKRVTPIYSAISGSGMSLPIFQLGTVSGFEITGYTSGGEQNGASLPATSVGFVFGRADSTQSCRGAYPLHLIDPASNTWEGVGGVNYNGGNCFSLCGEKSLAGVLTQLRFTFVNGTDTFDGAGGKFNLLVEG